MPGLSFLSPEPEPYPPLPFPPDAPPQEIWGTLYNKFYDWEYHESLSLIEGLKAYPVDRDDDDPTEKYPGDAYDSARSFTSRNRERGLDSEYFEFADYDENGEEEDSALIEAIVEDGPSDRRLNRTWLPNPRYTTCTPLASSITDISERVTITAPFLCYSDDPTFDLAKYLSLHHHLAWQTDFWDPDHEMIKVEAARLLHFQQGLRLQEIDDLRLPTFLKIRKDSADGLVWQASQRDALFWPESQMSPWPQLTLGYAKEAFSSTGQDIFGQVHYASTVFCPNLGCLASSSKPCQPHNVPAIREQKAARTTTEYSRSRERCGEQCFLYIEDEMRDDKDVVLDALLWPDGTQELETLESVLKLAPDALPCDLAVVCRSPCDQIFANRRRLISDEDILDDRLADPAPVRLLTTYLDVPVEILDPKTGETDYERPVLPIAPCSHPGPCRKGACSCFNESYPCDRNCRCSPDCPNRWKGCTCKRSKRKAKRTGTEGVCAEDSCACRAASRECEPELCLGCDAKSGKKCQNTDVQQRKFARIEVSKSDWGYGAFATENIPAFAYLGDYVGDVEPHDGESADSLAIAMIRKHLHLNYAFGLYGSITVDSRSSGNETRYLNHSPDSFNCLAIVTAVHNTYHIILTATKNIKAGDELLLHYGEKYWKDDEAVEEDNPGTKADSNAKDGRGNER